MVSSDKFVGSSNQFVEEVVAAYARMRRHSYPYTYTTRSLAGSPSASGLDIVVFPEVYSPTYFTDSEWFATELPRIVGHGSFLEIGTGTGIIALQVAINQEAFGGAQVTATDINAQAVANARHNFERYGVNASAIQSDVYDALDTSQKFDFIFWNHPFNCCISLVTDMLHRAGFDYEYRDLERYIAGARRHLTDQGTTLLGTSVHADLSRIEELARDHGYTMELLRKESSPLTPHGEFMTEYRIYALRTGGVLP